MLTQQSPCLPKYLYCTLYLCFVLSGAAGLIYQISWIKALGLIFGGTTYAITAVLCAFMSGLGLGSWGLGRYAEKVRNPLALYGWIELGIALTGLASLSGMIVTRWVYVDLYGTLSGHAILLLSYRFLASFLILLLPATLMGGTYPVILKYLARHQGELGALASRFYWLNTVGAVTGAGLAGFVLLWSLGIWGAIIVAAGLNMVAAGLVLLCVMQSSPNNLPDSGDTTARPSKTPPVGAIWVLLTAGISGLSAMMFEIGWARILAILLSSTTYAFTLMLATFLGGIALGSYCFERLHQRWRIRLHLLGYLQLFLAASSLLFLILSPQLAELTLWLAYSSQQSVIALLGGQFIISILAMIVPTFLFGLTFPMMVVLYCGNGQQHGARVGRLYAVNTLGSIFGAGLTGLLLIPWLGTVKTLLLGSGLIGVAAIVLLTRAPSPQPWRHALAGLSLLGILVIAHITQAFEHPVLRSRSALAGGVRRDFATVLTMDELVRHEQRVFEKEGVNATVTVARKQGNVILRTDGKSEASIGDQHTQLMVAYLPLSLHAHPRRVLIVGFGVVLPSTVPPSSRQWKKSM